MSEAVHLPHPKTQNENPATLQTGNGKDKCDSSGGTVTHTQRQSQTKRKKKQQQMQQQKWSKSKNNKGKPTVVPTTLSPTTTTASSPASTVESSLPPTPPPLPPTPSSATTTTNTQPQQQQQQPKKKKQNRPRPIVTTTKRSNSWRSDRGSSSNASVASSSSTSSKKQSAAKRIITSPFNLFRAKNKFMTRNHANGRNSNNNPAGQDDQTSNEQTPLIGGDSTSVSTVSTTPVGNAPAVSSLFSSPNLEMMEQGRSVLSSSTKLSSGWKKVIEHNKKGDFLLLGNAAGATSVDGKKADSQTHEEMVQEAMDEIRSGMEFTLTHCIIAIFVYLAIAVICYHFFFLERNANSEGDTVWTIVDTIYFAVTTFSKYDGLLYALVRTVEKQLTSFVYSNFCFYFLNHPPHMYI